MNTHDYPTTPADLARAKEIALPPHPWLPHVPFPRFARSYPLVPLSTMKEVGLGPATKDAASLQLIRRVAADEDARTFLFSPKLLRRLLDTELSTVSSESVQLPHTTTYVDVSALHLPLVGYTRAYGGKATMEGFVLTNYDFADHGTSAPERYLLNTFAIIRIDSAYGWYANLEWRKWSEDTFTPTPVAPTQYRGGFTDEKTRELSCHLQFNCLLYINSARADLRLGYALGDRWPKGKKARRAFRKKREEAGKVVRVGHHIHLPSTTQESHYAIGNGRKLTTRHKARGHWRNQWRGSDIHGSPLGPKRQELIWIPPCWKGPEVGDIVHGTYVVRERA